MHAAGKGLCSVLISGHLLHNPTQAIHLFSVSTLEAAKMNDIEMEGGGDPEQVCAITPSSPARIRNGSADVCSQMRYCEEAIRSKIAIGARSSKAHLIRDLVSTGYDERSVLRAMNALIKQGVLEQLQQGKQLRRAKS